MKIGEFLIPLKHEKCNISTNLGPIRPFQTFKSIIYGPKSRLDAKKTTSVGQNVLLNPNPNPFEWRPRDKSAPNYTCRRDIYALWCLIRDIMVHKPNPKFPDLTLTSLGCEYQATVPSWKSLSSEEFMKIYKPAKKPSFTFKPSKVQIRGEQVTAFTA